MRSASPASGRFLRSTSLDELPELWNILRGEMSLVGPRPLLMEYLDLLLAPAGRRHEVRPGLTGLAQVAGRNLVGWEERLELDVRYVETRSLALDLRIIGRTVGAVFRRQGISGEGEATMAPFEGSGVVSLVIVGAARSWSRGARRDRGLRPRVRRASSTTGRRMSLASSVGVRRCSGALTWLDDHDGTVVLGLGDRPPVRRVGEQLADRVTWAEGRWCTRWRRSGSDVVLGAGTVSTAGARLTTHISVGRHGYWARTPPSATTRCCEDYVTVLPGATVSGNVTSVDRRLGGDRCQHPPGGDGRGGRRHRCRCGRGPGRGGGDHGRGGARPTPG